MKSNRLIKEKSPYLLQHAYNPVDWFPWSEEAFEKSKSEDKPIFLSIGYSTCHWCHVMEKESFEDFDVAELINKYFIPIKVDREERPDIDTIYMSVCQIMTGSGGWPLTLFLTPDKKPFFAGTYFPKESRHGRIGMLELIPRINDVWNTKNNEIINSADEITTALNKNNFNSNNKIDKEILHNTYKYFLNKFDKEKGGFGNAPKFPTPHILTFLLKYYSSSNENQALEMVVKTLTEMRLGGIYDHVGFGFHRYSTDKNWLVPHFEKMLYDQAILIIAYSEAYQITKNNLFKTTVEEIIEYVLRDMTSDQGGFYSAEDADSEGEEGKFYIWEVNGINNLLNKDDSDFLISNFNLKDEGNWVDPFHNGITSTNILHLLKENDDNDFHDNWWRIRKTLFSERKKRIHPYKDDKILTDWNGLMIAAFSIAGKTFNSELFINAAEKSFSFIENNLIDTNGFLKHRYRDNEAGLPASIEDYSFLIYGLLELFEATQKSNYLTKALKLHSIQKELFWDSNIGGYFFTPSNGENLIIRPKESYDGAVPSGNSIALLNVVKLYKITSDIKFKEECDLIIKTFSGNIVNYPHGHTQLIQGIEEFFNTSTEIIVYSKNNDDNLKVFISKVNSSYIIGKTLIVLNETDKIFDSIPYLQSYKSNEDLLIYVCKNFVCNAPVKNFNDALELLNIK